MKLTKFKGGTSKASEDIAAQNRIFLQTFVWCELQRLASTIVLCLHQAKICKFARLCKVISSLLFKKSILTDFKAFGPAVLVDFS